MSKLVRRRSASGEIPSPPVAPPLPTAADLEQVCTDGEQLLARGCCAKRAPDPAGVKALADWLHHSHSLQHRLTDRDQLRRFRGLRRRVCRAIRGHYGERHDGAPRPLPRAPESDPPLSPIVAPRTVQRPYRASRGSRARTIRHACYTPRIYGSGGPLCVA
jgi:hypothetical protein